MSENYIVSARKYRPDTFASMVGQEAMSSTLKAAILSDKVAHAYLFCGPRGVGKTTAARVLAKTINCSNLSADAEACGQCESCRAFSEQRSFNIFELDAASNNGVDDIRALIEQVNMPPVLGHYKVYIIDEVHMLSSAAFNAFLKTLEEPPSYAIFILASTEKHKILPTILSRCQIYDFKRITVDDITRHLSYVAQSEGITAEEDALNLIAEKADGGMRDALSMFDRIASYSAGHISYQGTLDSLNILDHTYYIKLLEACLSRSYKDLLLLLDELLRRGFEGQIILSGQASFLRDLLLALDPATLRLLNKPQGTLETYGSLARRCTYGQLHNALRTLTQADQQYRSASSKRLLLELTFMNLISVFHVEPSSTSSTNGTSNTGTSDNQAIAKTTATSAEATTTTPSPEPVRVQVKQTPAPTPLPSATPNSGQQVQDGQERKRLGGLRAKGRNLEVVAPVASSAPSTDIETQNISVSEKSLEEVWTEFATNVLPEQEVIRKQILLSEMPKFISDKEVELALPNSTAVLQPAMDLLPQLEMYLRQHLNMPSLKLQIRGKRNDEEASRPKTREEQYQYLIAQYPAINTLVSRLSLRQI